MAKIRRLTLVFDANFDERLYIDGVAWAEQTDQSLYAGELVSAAGGKPCLLEEVMIDHAYREWPETLKEALKERARSKRSKTLDLFGSQGTVG